MASKPHKAGRRKGEPAAEVFRQFAWNLAGTLAKTTSQHQPGPGRQTGGARPPTGAARG